MQFSLLIANFNNGLFFKECYNSILEQTYKNWEVIIVDDCSSDDSEAVINNLIKGDQRFKFFKNEKNRGCGYTKNKAANQAHGEIAGFLDPDDTIFPEALEEMVKIFKNDSSISIVTSQYEIVGPQMEFIGFCRHGTPLPKTKSYLTFGQGALTHFASFKMSKFREMRGLDISMKRAVDQDLYYKMEEVGNHFFLDKILYRYRNHQGGISQGLNEIKAKQWHIYAICQAYKRRKFSNSSIDNFSEIEFKKFISNSYLDLIKQANKENRVSKYFFFIKSFLAYPTFQFLSKIKALR